jgi:hypothetical protein
MKEQDFRCIFTEVSDSVTSAEEDRIEEDE